MENKIDNNTDLKVKLISFYKNNKKKIIILVSIFLLIIISFIYLKSTQEKKNILIAEKYVKAGLYLASGNTTDSVDILEEIILSKNKFYSILALNTLIEKKLIKDKKKVLEYFKVIEAIKKDDQQKDIISLKKALFLMDIGEMDQSNILLNNLIQKNSKLKSIATEIIDKKFK